MSCACCSQTVPLPWMRACAGTRGDVCTVRSCPLPQDIVRTKSTDVGVRCHGPKITPRAIWKMKMRGRIQLSSFQLSEQQECSLRLQWSLTSSKEIRVIYPIQNQTLSSRGPQPWLLVFTQASIPLTSQHHCCMRCKLQLWDRVQNVLLLLPLVPAAFVKVIFLNSNFWHLYHQACRITPWMKRMYGPWKSSCLSHLKVQSELKQLTHR